MGPSDGLLDAYGDVRLLKAADIPGPSQGIKGHGFGFREMADETLFVDQHSDWLFKEVVVLGFFPFAVRRRDKRLLDAPVEIHLSSTVSRCLALGVSTSHDALTVRWWRRRK